ncbi:MAG: biotin/lipoate A/B protein ligase family protein [Candidatus Zixiibacteriota bacterium]
MKPWRVISTGYNDAFFNMALDEALLISCQKSNSPPILRLYQWKPPGISLGYSQGTAKTVDLKKCRDIHIDVVRRITGGRAVLHESELTYSVCASASEFPELGRNTLQTYRIISQALLESLLIIGIEGEWVKPARELESSSSPTMVAKPCFVSTSRYEITVNGRKLIGSAQRRFCAHLDLSAKESFIQHGSILTGTGRYNLADFLPPEGSGEKIKLDLEGSSTNLKEILKRELESRELISALKTGFSKIFDAEMTDSSISAEEFNRACVLKKSKYKTSQWNFRI